jgi:catechol 2,3-dioxygenase-like lactoylglutathione lyase family enzyme
VSGQLAAVVVNAADPPALARFWAGLLGVPVVDSGPDWAQLEGSLAFQSDPAPKHGPNRLHLDVKVSDLAASTAAVLASGARPLSDVQSADADPWRVFADPEGNEFCLVTA